MPVVWNCHAYMISVLVAVMWWLVMAPTKVHGCSEFSLLSTLQTKHVGGV